MKKIEQQYFSGERALYRTSDAEVIYSTFADGESPVKESHDLRFSHCLFKWRYPVWYSRNITLDHCTFYEDARAGVWYTENVTFKDCSVEAPKCFRRAVNTVLENVSMPNADEFFWHCKGVTMKNVTSKGDYFGMNSEDMTIDGWMHKGKYPFDGAKNLVIKNARLDTKDAFWNAENVTVYDSEILGEYLAWNSKNVTFVNCMIDSLQGMCYMDNVRLVNCRLVNTSLAFEYCVVDATVTGTIDSVFNPTSGRIVADKIGTLILDPSAVDPAATEIKAEIGKREERADWLPESN